MAPRRLGSGEETELKAIVDAIEAYLPDVLKPVIVVEKIPQPQSMPDRPLRPRTPSEILGF